MLAIRLTRTGKSHSPHYRIVVQEKRSKLNGKSIEIVGHYHPASTEKSVVLDKEKITQWLKQGAQPSDTVTNLLVKEGVLPKTAKVTHFYTAAPKAEAAPVSTPSAEAAPTEEPTKEESAPEATEATETAA